MVHTVIKVHVWGKYIWIQPAEIFVYIIFDSQNILI